MRSEALFAPGSDGKIPRVGDGGRSHSAEKACELAGGAEAGVLGVDEFPDEGEVLLGDIGSGRRREFSGRNVALAAGAGSAGLHGLAEVAEKREVEAGRRKGVVDHLLKAFEIGFLAALKEFDQAFCESRKVVWFFEKTIALTNAGGLDCDIAKVFELADRFDDFFLRFTDGGSGFLGVDFLPFPAGFGGFEELTQKGLAFGSEAIEEVLEVTGEGNFIGRIERGGGL